MIRERVKSGLERAKAQGKALGRPPIDAGKEAAIRADPGRQGGHHQARSVAWSWRWHGPAHQGESERIGL